MFTTEGHPLPIDAVRQNKEKPLQLQYQLSEPGNATLMTLHTHPFYRRVSLLLCTMLLPGMTKEVCLGHSNISRVCLGHSNISRVCPYLTILASR